MTSSKDPGVRSHGMKAHPPGYLWSKYECFLMSGWWDILHSSCFNVKLWSHSMNPTKLRTDERTYERKDENYIPFGINAWGIIRPTFFGPDKIELPRDKTNKMTVRTAKTQISLGGCPGWSETSLGINNILLVLSWGGSIPVQFTQI